MKIILNFLFAFFISYGVKNTVAVEANQWDNFSDSTTGEWTSGGANPNPPSVGLNGPGGADDKTLLASANGSSGAGGKLVIFNNSQWTGNYVSAGVTKISMHVNNLGTADLLLHLGFDGPGGRWWTIAADTIPSGSGWIPISFLVQASDLTGGTNVSSTLSGVTSLRILHSTTGGFNGTNVTAQIAIDNITAAAEPLPVELTSFSASLAGSDVTLKWETSSEKNNRGFEIERKILNKTDSGLWHVVGFKEGQGTSAEKHTYSFVDKINKISSAEISYRLKQIDFNGEFSYSNTAVVVISPNKFLLNQNYPNPFNPSTQINFQLNSPADVELKIFDMLGNEVKTILKEIKPAGIYSVAWNGENNSGVQVGSGTYFYRLSAADFTLVKKMILLR